MHLATLLLLILSAGLASQWLASLLRLPAIIVLIAVGLVLGPVTGVIEIGLSQSDLSELIGLGVAIILFEGGMDLKLGEARRVGNGIGRLTILGPPLTWAFGALAAHYVAGISWPVSWVLGAILVVTGPTVILPLLEQARLNRESASLLKWEGIVNDPVGVLIAVLTFQYFTISSASLVDVFAGLGAAVLVAALLGGVGGWCTGWLYRRGWVASGLKAPILMVLVLVAFWLSNQVQHEAGLLTVTVMGLVLGNMELTERKPLREFKENLTVVLLSVLFIVIPAQLEIAHLQQINGGVILFVLCVLFLVRPIAVALVTIGADMRWQDKVLLAWIAPRGIVAAATAGIFGPRLMEAGYMDAEGLLPIVFLVILVTVLAHGLSVGFVARRLGLAAETENGLLIVGATEWSQALAEALHKLDVDVLVADGCYDRLKPLRMAGIEVYYGEVLSEHAEFELDTTHLSDVICATDNDYYNALVCKAMGDEFGHHRTFQLATHEEAKQATRRLTLQQRGYFAFDDDANFKFLAENIDKGWTIQHSRLTDDYDIDKLCEQHGELGENWLPLATLSPKGELFLHTAEEPVTFKRDWRLIYFAPEQSDAS